nr:proteasome assembly chaperone 1-like [Penaeus vannamei]
MDLFFGEVKQVPSRAFDDDEEDLEAPHIEYEINTVLKKGMEDHILKCSTVIIACGNLATDFCETMFWSEKCSEAGVIEVKQEREISIEDTGDFRPRQPQPSKLFITPHSVLVCCTSRDVTPIIATQFVQKLFSVIETSVCVMVLSSHHYGALHGNYAPEGEDNCVVHSLCSPAFPGTPVYPSLPQPATLDSVPAAALTECIVNQRPCVAYPVFTETYSTGDLDLVVDAMKKVFHIEPFLKAAASLQDNSKLCQYRDRNMRKETLDRYM